MAGLNENIHPGLALVPCEGDGFQGEITSELWDYFKRRLLRYL